MRTIIVIPIGEHVTVGATGNGSHRQNIIFSNCIGLVWQTISPVLIFIRSRARLRYKACACPEARLTKQVRQEKRNNQEGSLSQPPLCRGGALSLLSQPVRLVRHPISTSSLSFHLSPESRYGLTSLSWNAPLPQSKRTLNTTSDIRSGQKIKRTLKNAIKCRRANMVYPQ
ncbi:hypothetical protein FJTKL_12061 [Diaporthe vaccinii]|uniref:Uncharacterized protein n=1 Tax=Diaporthe vaccinii TaxID=105482 RepID=A0ABR4FB31_9PEZI